jgi:hypothetical protein
MIARGQRPPPSRGSTSVVRRPLGGKAQVRYLSSGSGGYGAAAPDRRAWIWAVRASRGSAVGAVRREGGVDIEGPG